jgi:hypothetical protein
MVRQHKLQERDNVSLFLYFWAKVLEVNIP